MQNKKSKKIPRIRGSFLGIYKRKLLFFVFLIIIAGLGLIYISYNRYLADQIFDSTPSYSNLSNISIKILDDGAIYIDGKNSGKKISVVDGIDELRLPVVDQPGKYYDKVVITVDLPKAVAHDSNYEILAIHGVDKYLSYVKDSSTLVFEAEGVSKQATISVVAKLPPGTVEHPYYIKLISEVKNIKFDVWLTLAIVLPILTLIFMVTFLILRSKSNSVEEPKQSISSPPMAIPPALVGVLYHQQVGPRELAATLIDLARRKDIIIMDRDRGFAFGKGKFDQRLLGYEKILLSKVFRNNLTSERIEIEKRISNHLYSKKMSMVSASIYALATRLGYFRENPRGFYAKYQFMGIFALLIGLSGFAASFFFDFIPKFTSLLWVGMMASALIVAIAARRISLRTSIGNEALSNWLAFKNFLSDRRPIEYSPTVNQLFEAYLPYAIVLDCEAAWAKRFENHNFVIPGWFMTDKQGLNISDFCLSLFPIVSYVGNNLASIREPGFK